MAYCPFCDNECALECCGLFDDEEAACSFLVIGEVLTEMKYKLNNSDEKKNNEED